MFINNESDDLNFWICLSPVPFIIINIVEEFGLNRIELLRNFDGERFLEKHSPIRFDCL
jgi:hypothetical protein